MIDGNVEKNGLVETVGEVTSTVVGTRKWTLKKVILSIVTLYFLILILKYLGIFIWKSLGLLRRYIHDLTDEHKFVEVVIWTFIGVFLGVLLNKQILWLWEWVKEMWGLYIVPLSNGGIETGILGGIYGY